MYHYDWGMNVCACVTMGISNSVTNYRQYSKCNQLAKRTLQVWGLLFGRHSENTLNLLLYVMCNLILAAAFWFLLRCQILCLS